MKKLIKIGWKITVFSLLLLIFTSCGHKKKPTGGPKDTIKPKIVSVNPIEFSELGNSLEVLFSKPIEKSTIFTGIFIYPPILKKRYKWENNLLKINIEEKLADSTNYYFTFTKQIKGIHQNQLEENYKFIYYKGSLQNYSIYGNFIFEKEEDRGKKITLSLFSADSLFIFNKTFNTNSYKLDYLNKGNYIVKAFIDKNKNGKYDFSKEPYGEIFINDVNNAKADINLVYSDTTAPKIQRAVAINRNTIIVKFDEEISSINNLKIYQADSTKTLLKDIIYKFSSDSLVIISQPQDSVKYLLKIFDIKDLKGNSTNKDSIFFQYSAIGDTLLPKLINIYPKNGMVIKILKPQIKIRFDKLIKKINVGLINNETEKMISLKKVKDNIDYFIFKPQISLENFSSYTLKIRVKDYTGNENNFETKFIVMENQNED